MAANDVWSGAASVAAGAFQDIKPAAGVEAVLANIDHEGPAELWVVDGAVTFKFRTDTTGGTWSFANRNITETHYLQVKNTDSVARGVAWDGIQTK